MGWRGYETEIPVGMIFRRMFCHKCGTKLKKEKMTKLIKKGEEGYSNDILGHSTLGMSEISRSLYVYKCPNCNSLISYEKQCVFAKKQKQLKKKILDECDVLVIEKSQP